MLFPFKIRSGNVCMLIYKSIDTHASDSLIKLKEYGNPQIQRPPQTITIKKNLPTQNLPSFSRSLVQHTNHPKIQLHTQYNPKVIEKEKNRPVKKKSHAMTQPRKSDQTTTPRARRFRQQQQPSHNRRVERTN